MAFSLLFYGLFHVAFPEGVYCSFWSILGALRPPFRHLWGHIAVFFPASDFESIFKVRFPYIWAPPGGPNGSWRQRRGPSGALVKQHFGFITSGFASVKPQSVNLHPGDPC